MAEENQNPEQAPIGETAGENAPPSTVDKQAPDVVAENLKTTSDPEASEIPTANAPVPEENLVANTDEAKEKGTATAEAPKETDQQAKAADKPGSSQPDASPKADKPAAAKAVGDKPAAKAKKEKGPTVEDKPFTEFIQQDYLPAIKKAMSAQGVVDVDLTFAKQKMPVVGLEQQECWQIVGKWQNVSRQFNLYFPDEDIQGKKYFSCNEGSRPSTIEHFLGDERKMTLDLLMWGIVQRLNGQKWLSLN
jgi:Protein of unknown function (DUF2996)